MICNLNTLKRPDHVFDVDRWFVFRACLDFSHFTKIPLAFRDIFYTTDRNIGCFAHLKRFVNIEILLIRVYIPIQTCRHVHT